MHWCLARSSHSVAQTCDAMSVYSANAVSVHDDMHYAQAQRNAFLSILNEDSQIAHDYAAMTSAVVPGHTAQ